MEVATGRPARGRPFEPVAEAALLPSLRKLAHRLPGTDRGLLLVPEFVGPYGVVDLLAVTMTHDYLVRRWRSGIPPVLSEMDVQIVSAVRVSRSQSLDEIATSLQRPSVAVRRRIRRLTDIGALLSLGGNYKRADVLRPLGRLWALEAKVSDWRRGLGQATQYGLWADASAIVLGHLSTNPDYLASEARRLNVGLAVGTRWLVRPRINRQLDVHRIWASEHLFAGLLHSPTLTLPAAASGQRPSDTA